jgi:hypothetical protein
MFIMFFFFNHGQNINIILIFFKNLLLIHDRFLFKNNAYNKTNILS